MSSGDLALIGFLIFLEGVLSIDNAVVLAMMARGLPPVLQRKALTYGLVGAVFFRLVVLSLATRIIALTWVKFVGGGYLIAIAMRHMVRNEDEPSPSTRQTRGFWMTVAMIELMDIAFAIDSILAAVALTQKLWIVFTGGMIGVVMMRFAASAFLVVLKRFPTFETTAYLLVLLIGIKLILEGFENPALDFHSTHSPATWVFWGLMALAIAYGFRPHRRPTQAAEEPATPKPASRSE